MLDHMMKQILVQLDPRQLADLRKHIPARKRSEFIRNAVEMALLRLSEERTRRAYEKYPDDREEEPFDPADWAPESEAIHPEYFERGPNSRSAAKRRAPRRRATAAVRRTKRKVRTR